MFSCEIFAKFLGASFFTEHLQVTSFEKRLKPSASKAIWRFLLVKYLPSKHTALWQRCDKVVTSYNQCTTLQQLWYHNVEFTTFSTLDSRFKSQYTMDVVLTTLLQSWNLDVTFTTSLLYGIKFITFDNVAFFCRFLIVDITLNQRYVRFAKNTK